MYRPALVIVSAVALASCQHSVAPASVEGGECLVFHDPGFPVRGERAKDQRWITQTQENGIEVCGWDRPAPEPDEPTVADLPAPSPTTPTPAPAKHWWQRIAK